MFVPIKADFELPRFPAFTIVVCLICLVVFGKQLSDREDFARDVHRYCMQDRSQLQQMVFSRIEELNGYGHCAELMLTIDAADDEEQLIDDIVLEARPLVGLSFDDSRYYMKQMLEEELQRYRSIVGPRPGEGLAYYTRSWNPLTMVTSSFAHGSWMHIIGNLIFFFAFAATVEGLVGTAMFGASIIAMSLFIGVFCSVGAYATGIHYTTVGLSGIVTGMIGMFAYLLPRGRIRCFYWFIVIFGFIAVPAWILALWYIGSDIYRLFAVEDNGIINVMAHVSGGLAGYLFGAAFLRKAKERARDLQLEIDVAEA
ncbi:MAG: rhomboid family intramembrane serine protease [Woeseiaceae bacterium]|nr:rhomboid family intramembrane serine protease [Woeseiaceae bacterium]